MLKGSSEVRRAGTSVAFQYRANIQCSDPNTLRFSIGERKEREFVTETSSLGNVTEVLIYIDRRVMLDIKKLPVTDNKAILYISDLADVLSESVLLRIHFFKVGTSVFVLSSFRHEWNECIE